MAPQTRTRARRAAIALLSAAAIGLSGCSGSGPSGGGGAVSTLDAGLSERIDAAVAAAMEWSGSSAAIAGVWTESGDHVAAYGEGVQPNSAIRGAQATQPVLCALLLDLAREGTVDLDRPVSDDVPRQIGIAGITYRQLCDGTSGLADFAPPLADIFANNPSRPWPDRELLAQALPHSPLSWPGLDVHVSNTDSILLARALHAVTRRPIAELLEERVFGPAGMGSSFFPDPASTTLPGGGMTGLSYPSSGGSPVCDAAPQPVPAVAPAMLGPGGATVTTASDLKKFYTHYLSGFFGGELSPIITETRALANPERDESGAPVAATEPDPNAAQWGFGVEKVGPLFGRSGAITGTLTSAYHDPTSGLTVVVALNNSSAGGDFSRALAFQLAALAAEAGVAGAMPWAAEVQGATLQGWAVCAGDPAA